MYVNERGSLRLYLLTLFIIAKNREFMDAGKLFIEQTLLIAEAVRLLPHVISG